MKQALKIILGSALVTAALIKGVPALAETPTHTNVSVVRTADLDLSSQSGQRQLDRRLVIAAGEVCGDASDVDLKGLNDARRCRAEVLAAARTKAESILAARSDAAIVIASSR
jgi:UrcA family protein